jgi:tetratricopeptide (TPR) repeat protein
VFGVATVLHILLTGTSPRGAINSDGRDECPFLTRRLEGILLKALHSDPLQRHRSLEQFAQDIAQCRWPVDLVNTLVEDARLFQQQGKLAQAYDALDRALKYDPGNHVVHSTRAEIFFLEGDPKWALIENSKALDVEPTAGALLLHGQCLLALNEYKEAEVYFRRSLELDSSSRGRLLLAKCLEKLGQDDQAVGEYQVAVRLALSVEHNSVLVDSINEDLTALLKRMNEAAGPMSPQ